MTFPLIHDTSLILCDRLKSTSRRPRIVSVSVPRKKRNALRAKIFDTLERPIGFARLPRRANVGTVKNADFHGALSR